MIQIIKQRIESALTIYSNPIVRVQSSEKRRQKNDDIEIEKKPTKRMRFTPSTVIINTHDNINNNNSISSSTTSNNNSESKDFMEIKTKMIDQVSFFSDMALEHLARKVTSVSSDVRRLLELCMYNTFLCVIIYYLFF